MRIETSQSSGFRAGIRAQVTSSVASILSLLDHKDQVPLVFTLLVCLSACKEKQVEPPPLYVNFTPTSIVQQLDSNGYYAVVEIPAGTTTLQGIDTSGRIVSTTDQQVDFLPFPGNYGFVSGCGRIDSVSGILTPLPVLVMMHALNAQSLIKINPLATLVLSDNGRAYPVVIAVPSDTTLQSIRIGSFVDFITEYDAARHILQQWFLNYRGREVFDFTGWRDEHYTRQLIADWKQTK